MSELYFDTDLLSLLPPWYRRILDYRQICTTESAQLEALAQEIVAVADNFFYQTMDAGSVAQWEQIFGILADPSTETLAFRRARVLNRVSTRPPFTLNFLYGKLNELIGLNAWTVSMDYPNYTLYIESSAENQTYATEVAYTINLIKPAHIVYINRPYVQTGVLVSETVELSQRIFNYRLGSWGLGVLPFASENSQGVIKTATTPSITADLLADIATFVEGDVASAQINGSISITGLSKSVSGNTLTVSYTVTPEQATEVTQVALLDSSGTILTSSTVYVPVGQSTIFKHTIPVAEGVNANGN